ncbi:valine--tRNA ligase [bacterium K02(2017)]|nr:valine--tRNA ligase [bacterium K02(2017)]
MTEQKSNTRFNPTEVEPKILKRWKEKGCFKTAVDKTGKVVDENKKDAQTYVIAIPPPNVTGRLHMGHALNNTIQDMLIRYKRMDGYDALWVPGTDHAGIATQTVVKKMLDAEGVDYRELGREKFVDKIWEWKEKYGGMILKQLESIGCSCDWDRNSFTMSDSLNHAVNYTFKKLYDDGLIYRGNRIVNWCPVDKTALSDDEIETKDGGEKGFLWHIKYPFKDGSGHLVVATTRPETLFGDVAVAVNPKDDRFSQFIGKEVVVPLQERVVKVIGDNYVDMEFGTGCLKITPAHDANDFEVGNRHNLKPITVMHEDASMNEVVPERYQGLDRYKCREKAIEELKEKELLVSEEERMTPLGRSYRSKAVIEYRLSDQWFVKMKPLADKVLKRHDELNIQPERWNKVYLDWLNNIRDWCVSRQIWWGHRIPAWYCENSVYSSHPQFKNKPSTDACPPMVDDKAPLACANCGSKNLLQESDVLDTWFSSALWPMSTLGWPQKTSDFKRYFPTSALVTGKDIIFFWVARMNFMGVYFEDTLPYKDVYINPIVLDEKGVTMSKSKGNGIDPMIVVNGATLEQLKEPVYEARPTNLKEIVKRLEKSYPDGFQGAGADALRYTLLNSCSSGQQLKIALNTFHDVGLRFVTKLWNAARFVMMAIEKEESLTESFDFSEHLTDEDRWVSARFQLTTNKIRNCLDEYDFTNLGQIYYQYVWNDFCDWYIELCKERFNIKDDKKRLTALHHLAVVFTDTLRLLSPLIPFVTEEIYTQLATLVTNKNLWGDLNPQNDILMKHDFPQDKNLNDDQNFMLERFAGLQRFVGEIRTMRKTYLIKDGVKLRAKALAINEVASSFLNQSQSIISRLAGLESLEIIASKEQKPVKTVTIIDPSFEIYLEIAEYIDIDAEKKRLLKEVGKMEKYLTGVSKKLSNPGFIKNASTEVVQVQRDLQQQATDKLNKTKVLLEDLATW